MELEFSQVEKTWAPNRKAATIPAARYPTRRAALIEESFNPEEPRRRPGDITRKEQSMAKKIVGFIKLQVPAGKANPSPPIGPGTGPAWSEHHGVLQGVQCADAELRAGSGAAGGASAAFADKSFPLHHQVAARRRADQEGDQAGQGVRRVRTWTRSARSRALSSKRSPRPR